jgi:hypothetical protein
MKDTKMRGFFRHFKNISAQNPQVLLATWAGTPISGATQFELQLQTTSKQA